MRSWCAGCSAGCSMHECSHVSPMACNMHTYILYVHGVEAAQLIQVYRSVCVLSSRCASARFGVTVLHRHCFEMHTIEHAVQLLSYPLSADLLHQGFPYLQAAYSSCSGLIYTQFNFSIDTVTSSLAGSFRVSRRFPKPKASLNAQIVHAASGTRLCPITLVV